MTVPGPGTWTLAVWLTDAAGNSSAITATDTTLSVPTDGTRVSSAEGYGEGSGGSGSSGDNGPSGSSSSKKATIHVGETLHGSKLIVRVSGPETGKVRVSFTGRLAGRIVASGAKVVMLKRGRLDGTFTLGPHTAALATIQVSASLGHDVTATSTIRRHHTRSTLSVRHQVDAKSSCPTNPPGCIPGRAPEDHT